MNSGSYLLSRARKLFKRCWKYFCATPLPKAIPTEFLKTSIFLILDHDAGGGANSYRAQMAARLIAQGQTVILWQYLRGLGCYLLELRSHSQATHYRAKTLDDSLCFLNSLSLETVFLNSIVCT